MRQISDFGMKTNHLRFASGWYYVKHKKSGCYWHIRGDKLYLGSSFDQRSLLYISSGSAFDNELIYNEARTLAVTASEHGNELASGNGTSFYFYTILGKNFTPHIETNLNDLIFGTLKEGEILRVHTVRGSASGYDVNL